MLKPTFFVKMMCFCVSTVFGTLDFGLKMGVGVYLGHKFSTDYWAETRKKSQKNEKKATKSSKKLTKMGEKEKNWKKSDKKMQKTHSFLNWSIGVKIGKILRGKIPFLKWVFIKCQNGEDRGSGKSEKWY